MLSIIFIILAAICNAVMDTLSFHFSSSIFSKKKPNFWDPNISWRFAKKIGGYKLDAWHLFKSSMIVFLVISIIIYNIFPFPSIIKWYFQVPILGVAWNLTFNLFFNKIFTKKQ